MLPLKLFIGLGNPGAKYARNRHNVGFMALDEIANAHGFSDWRAKFQGQLSEGRFGSEKIFLLKPETFMNNSGQSVQAALKFFKLDVHDVVVFHDEIDLAPGKIKVKSGGGHAGHNGLRSIHAHIGSDYHRVRIGVGHPGQKDRVPSYVLSDFAKADQAWLDDVLKGIGEGAPDLAARDNGRFMNAVAKRLAPSRPSTGQKKVAEKTSPERGSKSVSKEPEPVDEEKSLLQKLVDRFS